MANFVFPSASALSDLGGAASRYQHNLAALRVLKQIEAEKREAAPEEQLILSHYSGWGDSEVHKKAFPNKNGAGIAADPAIEAILSKEERLSLEGSILNAHYTSIPIVQAIWKALLHYGIKGNKETPLRILEPAAGASGNFIGMRPTKWDDYATYHAVEIDPLSARIFEALYPETRVFNKGFEEVPFPHKYYDLIISNVPFSSVGVFDKSIKETALKQSLHDYFFVKSVQLAKPDGIIAFITSRYTMDKKKTAVRAYLKRHCDLLAAVRLPETAFQENAGTQVVTDILILRKKSVQEIKDYRPVEGDNGWIDLEWGKFPGQFDYRHIEINSFFVKNPHFMLGKPSVGHGMHNEETFRLKPHNIVQSIEEQILTALRQQLPKNGWKYHAIEDVKEEIRFEEETREPTEGLVKEPDRDRKFTDLLIETYHTTKRLIQAESRCTSSSPLEGLRQDLNRVYGDFYQLYGPINDRKNTLRLEKTHPCLPLLLSLEEKNATGQFIPAAIFTRRIVRGEIEITENITPQEALIISYNKYGRVNIAFIATQLKTTVEEAFAQLGDEIFQDPNGGYYPRAQYLSGNIQEKLEEAKRAALFDDSFQRNVDALQATLPTPLTAGEVPVRLGSPWIPPHVILAFIRHLIPAYPDNEHYTVEYIAPLTTWRVNKDVYPASGSIENKSTWGTQRAPALWLIECGLNLKTPNVFDPVLNSDKFVINQSESANAQAKLDEIKTEFVNWVWKDAARAELLCQIYNDKYNCFVSQEYDGSHLTLPGLSTEITPHKHQKDGVWRILQNRNTLLGHVGGAGKTGTMVMAAYELRRLGICRRPVVAVPNHLPQQWADEARKFYPGIKVYCPDKNAISARERGKLLSTIATADYDLIIIPHTAVKYLPLKTETIKEFHQQELDDLRNYLLESGDKKNKDIQRAIKRLENKLKELNASIKRDSEHTISFEECGIDALFLDEFHEFKNLGFTTKATRVAGMPNTNSQRAYDLFMKSRILQQNGGRFIGGTGTPVSNSLCEAYTCQKFFMLERMIELGIHRFDAWAQTFCDNSVSIEMKPDGSGFRTNTRFNRVTGLPELSAIWRETLDVKTAEQINLQRPDIFNEKPTVIEIPPSRELKEIIKSLAKRSDKLKAVDPSEDNMLMITTDGRRAALDTRLYNPSLPEPKDSKISRCANNVAEIYRKYNEDKACQIIFCDLGTPKPSDKEVTEEDLLNDTEEEIQNELRNSSFYQALKNRMIQAGVPTHEIAFIHDAKTAEAKARLFQRMNAGEIRVLIGSTGKCGTGMNAQERMIAVHHLDTPWRPADLDQRNWRGQRPGNKYPQIYIYQYITTNSFDAFSWSIIESKSTFVSQLMAGKITARTAENIDDTVLTAAQVKAIASGNPRIMEKVGLETELAKLERLYIAWRNDQQKWTRRAAEIPEENAAYTQKISNYTQAIAIRDGIASSDFTLLENKKEVTYAPDKAENRLSLFAAVTAKEAMHSGTANYKVGSYRGFTIHLSSGKVMANYRDILDRVNLRLRMQLNENTEIEIQPDLRHGFVGTIQRAINLLEEHITTFQNKLTRNHADLDSITKQLERPWNHAAKYKEMQTRLNELNQELTEDGQKAQEQEASLPLEGVNEETISAEQTATVTEEEITIAPLILGIPTLASLSNDAPVPMLVLSEQSADEVHTPFKPTAKQEINAPAITPQIYTPPTLNEQLSLFSDFRPTLKPKARKATAPASSAQLSLF